MECGNSLHILKRQLETKWPTEPLVTLKGLQQPTTKHHRSMCLQNEFCASQPLRCSSHPATVHEIGHCFFEKWPDIELIPSNVAREPATCPHLANAAGCPFCLSTVHTKNVKKAKQTLGMEPRARGSPQFENHKVFLLKNKSLRCSSHPSTLLRAETLLFFKRLANLILSKQLRSGACHLSPPGNAAGCPSSNFNNVGRRTGLLHLRAP